MAIQGTLLRKDSRLKGGHYNLYQFLKRKKRIDYSKQKENDL
jgi:hypothetical protein